MTQGIFPFPQGQQRFDTVDDRLPPCNIEAEEAILGGILFDPNAIYRIKDRLKPEHFYISAHKDIYQACLRLCNKNKGTDLLNVTSWLTDHDILARVGGRNKLASVLGRTIGTANIDELATLVIDKAERRDVIRTANEMLRLGYSTEIELAEIKAALAEKTKTIIDTPSFQTKDENLRAQHSRLLDDLTSIYTTCPDPSERFFRLHHLANEYKFPVKSLEHFYLKSLINQCSNLLTYEELKEVAGYTVREWLLNGLVPKNTTILLTSDGGVGKTKFVYAIGKILIQGSNFGVFQSTGEKRRILYYQGDESEGDMLQALETLGYSESDISKYVRVRFGWSAENMPTLIQDLNEFQPDVVFIDSLSTANRFSPYRESEMEYARPILEMTGLANQHKTVFVILHHTNKQGGVRGTTAIRNAVSEVWTLAKDNSNTATPYDRILEIDKSRSRSSGKKYRLMFNPEDLGFTFLGEEGEQLGGPAQSAKEKTLELLASHRNIKFTCEEIAHRLGISKDYARRYLAELSGDSLVSVVRHPAIKGEKLKPNQYFLAYEGSPKGSPKDHILDQTPLSPTSIDTNGLQPIPKLGIKKQDQYEDQTQDQVQNPATASDAATGDPAIAENGKKSCPTEVFEDKEGVKDHQRLNALPDNNSDTDPRTDPPLILNEIIHESKTALESLPVKDSSSSPQSDPGGDPSPILPLIQEKGVYFSLSCKREVTAFHIFDNLSEVSCHVPGRGVIGLPFTDLRCCDKSPRHNLSMGDKVVILEGKHKETFATITTIRADGIWLKSEQGKSLRRAFFPHQVVKG